MLSSCIYFNDCASTWEKIFESKTDEELSGLISVSTINCKYEMKSHQILNEPFQNWNLNLCHIHLKGLSNWTFCNSRSKDKIVFAFIWIQLYSYLKFLYQMKNIKQVTESQFRLPTKWSRKFFSSNSNSFQSPKMVCKRQFLFVTDNTKNLIVLVCR